MQHAHIIVELRFVIVSSMRTLSWSPAPEAFAVFPPMNVSVGGRANPLSVVEVAAIAPPVLLACATSVTVAPGEKTFGGIAATFPEVIDPAGRGTFAPVRVAKNHTTETVPERSTPQTV
jgi:hypothetical protein